MGMIAFDVVSCKVGRAADEAPERRNGWLSSSELSHGRAECDSGEEEEGRVQVLS